MRLFAATLATKLRIELMGFSYTGSDYAVAKLKREHAREEREREATATKRRDGIRQKLADRIVNVCIDTTVSQIIRPGPKPEERECYEVANELRAIKGQLVELVAEILRISAEED
jgi:hypothetical protein